MLKVLVPLVAACLTVGQDSSLDLTEIWKAGLRERSGPPSRVVVVMNETAQACRVSRDPCFTIPETGGLRPRVPADLTTPLTSSFDARPQTVSGLTVGAMLVSRSELESTLRSEGAANDIWRRFYGKYPNTAGFVIFGNPAFDESGQRALLLMDHYYGNLGAEGKLLLLERNRSLGGEAGYWRVTQSWTLWQS